MLAAILALGIVAAACGGSDDGSPPKAGGPEAAAPLTVTSEDGLLILEVPGDLVPEGEEITVTQRSGDEIPELAKAGLTGTVYELAPDGLGFSGPVTITRKVDPETVGTDIDEAMPVPLLMVRDSEGGWEWLEDQVVRLDPDDASKVQVSGTTTHFSTVVAFGGLIEASMEFEPDRAQFSVGEEFITRLRLTTRARVGDVKPRVAVWKALFSGAAMEFLEQAFHPAGGGRIEIFTCVKAGAGPLEASFTLDEGISGDLGYALFHAVVTDHIYDDLLEGARIAAAISESVTVVLSEDLICEGKKAASEETPPPVSERRKPVLTAICGSWLHESFREFLSRVQIRALFEFLKPGDTIFVRAKGVNGGKTIEKQVDEDAFGLAIIRGGINELGAHPITSFEVVSEDGEVFDFTDEVRARIGDFIVEDEQEGEIGDC